MNCRENILCLDKPLSLFNFSTSYLITLVPKIDLSPKDANTAALNVKHQKLKQKKKKSLIMV